MIITSTDDLRLKGKKLLTVQEYIETRGLDVSVQAINYQISEGKLDILKIERDRLIIMNDKALNYVPRRKVREVN